MFSDILQTDLNAHQQDAMRGDYDVAHTDQDRRNIEETISYKPEESWNYEAGTHLNLFGGRLHADLAVYYMQVRNQQLSVMSPDYNYGRIMVNAGKSHSCGVETTLRGSAFENALDWGVAYGFTHAKFDEYDTYEDHYVPFVPQHTFSAMAGWHMGRFSLGAHVTGQGKTWWDEANTYCQKIYALLGAHADYDFGPVLVSLWGRNLTNTHYNTFAIESSAAGAAKRFAQPGNPLQLGIDLRLHFH
jgi:outer membrane receptor for ferric coprogen and ferric-rhodotorulic acid